MVKLTVRNILQILFVEISLLLLILTAISAFSPNIVKSIPGYPGDLPFYLETGYVGVGKDEEVKLFYYFIKSERDPERDPLMLWLTGGPGCSAFSGLVIEIGPLIFNNSACDWHSKSPTFQLNPSSWTKVASIIFLDSPVGTGFSYATNPEGYYSDDITSSRHIYQFLTKWLADHAGFHNHPLYIAGDSYCGRIVPVVVQEIFQGNKVGFQPFMNLQGYILGNPLTWKEDEMKSHSQLNYAHRVSLLSDELYESTITSCNGAYQDVDMDNINCTLNLQAISYNLDPLFDAHVLKPKCISDKTWCQESIYGLLYNWANDIQVQAALHIQEGTKRYWIRCNKTLAYEYNVESTVGYHQNLTQEFIHVLIYRDEEEHVKHLERVLKLLEHCQCGDQDMKISYVGTLGWIKMLNISISEDWRPWFVNDQVAGYTTRFANDRYNLTFATVKGAGHTAPEYKRAECFNMLMKWLESRPL
ncbi:serine carboxypeptidase-like 7 isoform X4 [Beta vulgaris subsp. vulgaris]|uniref:serine carboxypeptidase-like 7 isoform X4 n=1 Tax=Beta vulgaris subsp. vulgaris TaxID=3555 RepID=UPI00053F9AF6|nr:serine carboxypeptidase-like 7 isoform X4 [Beta vulgaris subsp. vulgaris]